MSNNSFFNSPTVVLPATAPDQYFASSHYSHQHQHSNDAPMLNGISPNGLANSNAFFSNSSVSTPGPVATPGSLAGRKRSRADIYSNDDEEDERLDDGSVSTPPTDDMTKPRGQPVYGPGMTILYPDDPGYAMAAESQSGTWVEEKAERKPFSLAHAKRPSVTSRKSQRMNSTASGPDDLAQLVLPPSIREVTQEPLIDEATRRLGISFKRMDSSEALQINQKAYSKWIQNHYPALSEVSIWFENSSIPGYLVSAVDAYKGRCFFIFSEDLTEARLVTTDPSELLARLDMLPALHLAAPGGHIRAETDPIAASQNEVTATITGFHDSTQSNGCAAHAMELD